MHSALRTTPRLRQLELELGIRDWAIPSIETQKETPDGASREEADSVRVKLGVLNGCHGTHLTERELEICISLVDFRLGTVTTVRDVLGAFFRCPVFEAEGVPLCSREGSEVAEWDREEMNDALMVVNMRSGMSVLLGELELVVALVGFVRGRGIGVREVLGLRGEGGRGVVDGGLAGALGRLDLRVGERFAVEDLGDVFDGIRL